MQENKHRHDFDVTRLVPVEKSEPKPKKNPLLNYLEVKEVPPRGAWNKGKGEISERRQHFIEALQFMDPCKHSLLIEKKDRYQIEKAAKGLGYRLTYRIEDIRGIKLYRYWVLSHSPETEEKE